MRRLLSPCLFAFVLPSAALAATAAVLSVASCGSSSVNSDLAVEDASLRKDGGRVEPAEGGTYDASGPPGPAPECAAYCSLVMESCSQAHAQYASTQECLAFCSRLPPGKAGASEGNSVACRQFYAGSPARLDAVAYCLAAGPFGGGVCGDRCQSFCELTLDTCSPDAGDAPYTSYPDCQGTCIGYAYRDGGVDGGGEPPTGPAAGNTLNCRLFYARTAVTTGTGCADLGLDSGACR
jgi:hypothetical protein